MSQLKLETRRSPDPVKRDGAPSGRKSRDATRRRLAESALELFAEQGYEETTTRQIAEAANVTERCFFQHFATKSEAIDMFRTADDLEALLQSIVDQPPGPSDAHVLERAVTRWFLSSVDITTHRRIVSLMMKARRSVVIRGTVATQRDNYVAAAAEGLARRRGEKRPSVSTRILVEAVLIAHALIVQEWSVSDERFERIAARYYRDLNLAFAPK
jgi:AcrR family transcriptional regulator